MGVFTNALVHGGDNRFNRPALVLRDMWLSIFERLRRRTTANSRLAILGRITVAPRQTVALIEVDGEKLLVGTSQEGSPRFLRLGVSRRERASECGDEVPFEGTVA